MHRAMAAVALLVAAVSAHAQGADAKPWTSAGTRVGEEIVGPDGGPMVWVPAGKFSMGSTGEDVRYARGRFNTPNQHFDKEHPVHKVRISKGFWIGKHEVTNDQYRAFCEATGTAFPTGSVRPGNHPVETLSWGDAVAYTRHHGLSLLTEAQWEYAARGPENRWFPWGNFWESSRCCYVNHKPPNGGTFPVGSFPDGASWCGALDMAGNVLEWCLDWFDTLYYGESPDTDPTGPITGEYRAMRGGQYADPPHYIRSANRGSKFPELRHQGMGLRACITP